MDVLVVATNRCQDPEPVIPLGACLAATAAEAAGHRVRFVDLMFEGDPVGTLQAELEVREPTVVGFSVRNIDNNVMGRPEFYLDDVLSLVRAVRHNTRAEIVLGGAAASLMPEALLRYVGARWAVTANGDRVFPALLEALAQGGRPRTLPGLAELHQGRFRQDPAAPNDSPKTWPSPDLRRWVDLSAYRSKMGTVPVQTKRGCPFRCVYCTYPFIEGSTQELRSPEDVADEVYRLARFGTRDVEFVDNVFNAPPDHAVAVCAAVARRGVRARLHTHDLNPAFVDRDLLDAMEAAGFVGVGITAESAADPVLEGLGKGYGAEAVQRAAELLRSRRFPCLWIFLLGAPGETLATVQQTLAFARGVLRPGDAAFFNVGVRVYPGTELERIARREGLLEIPRNEMLQPVFYVSPQVDAAVLARTVGRAIADEPRFLGDGVGGWQLLPAAQRVASRLGVAPPLWRHAGRLRRGLRWLGVR